MNIKVVTYNLHKGKNILGNPYHIERLRTILSQQSYDLGFFQEVLGHHQFKDDVDHQVDILTSNIGSDFSFSKNSIIRNREYGNSIMSKFKISNELTLDLTINRLEKRSALLSLIDFNGIKVQCICTHLNLLRTDRLKQARMLINFIKKNVREELPVILGGDLNDRNGEITKLLVTELGFSRTWSLHTYPTFPSFLPILPLDRILFRNLKVVSSKTGEPRKYKVFSDHLPLFFEFELGLP